jgi:hypothetical protein
VIGFGTALFDAIKVSVPPVVLTYISANKLGVPPLALMATNCSKFQLPEGIVVILGSLNIVANEPINWSPAPDAVNVVPAPIYKSLSKT